MMTSCRTSQTTIRDENRDGDIANGPDELYDPLLSKISVDFDELPPMPTVIEIGRPEGMLRRVWGLRLPVYTHLIAFLVYTLVIFVLWRSNESRCYPVEPYSPARIAQRFRLQVYEGVNEGEHTQYTGPPKDPMVEQAWNRILPANNILITRDELKRAMGPNHHGFPISRGDQEWYVASLSVGHDLHCLKWIRDWSYPDYYFPNITEDQKRENRGHLDHCLEVLRNSVMCHADITLFSLKYYNDQCEDVPDFSQQHSCTDWSALSEWFMSRSMVHHRWPFGAPGTHPLYGSWETCKAEHRAEGNGPRKEIVLGFSEDGSVVVRDLVDPS